MRHVEWIRSQIDEGRLRERLERYPAIGALVTAEELLAPYAPPYGCHGLAWRLGVWGAGAEAALANFDRLLSLGASLPGWSSRVAELRRPDFGDYWSAVWELQVAEFLAMRNSSPTWRPSGPDLRVTLDGGAGYVECYTFQKSFAFAEFLQEALHHLHPGLRLLHRSLLPFSLPQNQSRDSFLDGVLTPLLDPRRLSELESQAQVRYPVVIPLPPGTSGAFLFMESDNPAAYDPLVVPELNDVGAPEPHLSVVLKEILGNKMGSNNISNCRPILLAANVALSPDYQLATGLRNWQPVLTADQRAIFDALLIAVCGIDASLQSSSMKWCAASASSPFSQLALSDINFEVQR